MSLFFIKFMLKTKKMSVTATIQTKLSSKKISVLPRTKPRVMFTTCVKGRKTWAAVCKRGGNCESGKKVPLSRNMGVMSKNAG